MWWKKIYKSKLVWGLGGVVGTLVLGKTLKSYMGATYAKLPKELDDHVYIVTGANSGIGEAVAEELGKRGARGKK